MSSSSSSSSSSFSSELSMPPILPILPDLSTGSTLPFLCSVVESLEEDTASTKETRTYIERFREEAQESVCEMGEKDEISQMDKLEDGEKVVCEAEEEEEVEGVKMEGMASIALLPDGSISGHFVHLPNSVCYGIHGTEIACERECSRGEDYRLVKLTIMDYNSKKERDVVVERKGHDAARLCNVDHAHGWEKDVVKLVDEKQQKSKIVISFECETLKADEAAEEHIKRYMPKLTGMDAVVNIGKMSISGLDFKAEVGCTEQAS